MTDGIDGKNLDGIIVSADISSLYAARQFLDYLTVQDVPVEEPEGPSVMSVRIKEVLERRSDELIMNYSSYIESSLNTESGGAANENYFVRKWRELKDAASLYLTGYMLYRKIKGDVKKAYFELKGSGVLSESDQTDYDDFQGRFSPYIVPRILFSRAEHLREGSSEDDVREMIAWNDKMDALFQQYLLSGGVEATSKGHIAWRIADHAGFWFSQYVHQPLDKCPIPKAEGVVRITDRRAIKMPATTLDTFIAMAIDGGLFEVDSYADGFRAVITDKDGFKKKATDWLRQQIHARLDRGSAFNLLDEVSLRKECDGYVQMTIDRKAPFKV